MPFVPIDRVIRVVLKFTKDTREFQNVLHVQKLTPVAFSDLVAVANEAVQWWTLTYSNGASNQVCLYAVIATDMTVEGGMQYTADVSPAVCGVNASAPVPANSTATISWRTGRTGRRYRGRSYVVGLAEPGVSDFDTLAGSVVTWMATSAVDWILRTLAISLPPVVASFTYASAEQILSAVIENVVDSQRRRLPRRGR